MSASRLACVAWLWLYLILTPHAHAQQDARSAPADAPAVREPLQLREPMAPRVERVWYGWQTLIADGVAGPVLLGLLMSESDTAPIWITFATWGLAAPVLHFAHGNFAEGAASIALRAGGVGLTALVFVFSWLAGSGSGGWVAAVACVIGIAAIDAGALAYEERTVTRQNAALQLAPLADRATRTLGLMLVGTLD